MPHGFSNSERIRREIQALVDQKKQEQPQAQPAKSEAKPRKASKQKKRTR